MGARILFAFATFIGVTWLLSGLVSGGAEDSLTGLAVTIVAGALLWRSLRDTEVTRKAGLRATVYLSLTPGPGVARKGTYARIKTHKASWDVALDRQPERADFNAYSHGFSGWVWLDEAGLPQRARINYAKSRGSSTGGTGRGKSWPVLSAVPAPPSEGTDT